MSLPRAYPGRAKGRALLLRPVCLTFSSVFLLFMVFTVPSEDERDPSDRGDEGANAEEELAALLLSRARLTSNAQTFFNTLPLEVFYLFLIYCLSFDALFNFSPLLRCVRRHPITAKTGRRL